MRNIWYASVLKLSSIQFTFPKELASDPKYESDLMTTFTAAVDESSQVETIMKHFEFEDKDQLEAVLNAPGTRFHFLQTKPDVANGVFGVDKESGEVLVLSKTEVGGCMWDIFFDYLPRLLCRKM